MLAVCHGRKNHTAHTYIILLAVSAYTLASRRGRTQYASINNNDYITDAYPSHSRTQ